MSRWTVCRRRTILDSVDVTTEGALKHRAKYLKYVPVALLFVLLIGCQSIGPNQIKLDRNRYNDVIQETSNEQLLMNIVRLRYIEPMTNLKLTNITSSYTLNPGLSLPGTGLSSVTGGKSAPAAAGSSVMRTLNIDPSIQYLDTPTITYTPVENAQFVKELMEPLALNKIYLFEYGGLADSSLIFRLAFQQVGEMDNASSASSERMRRLPTYKKYYEFVEKLTYMFDHGEADIKLRNIDNHSVTVIYFTPKSTSSRRANEVRDLLGIKDSTSNEIILTDGELPEGKDNFVYAKMRSVYGIMIYLSQGVEIPESDINKHHVYSYFNKDGTPFDWEPLMQGLLNIQYSDSEPDDAFVQGKIHGHWFYIDNADLDSKTTFLMLTRLIALSSSSLDSLMGNGPALTLPAR